MNMLEAQQGITDKIIAILKSDTYVHDATAELGSDGIWWFTVWYTTMTVESTMRKALDSTSIQRHMLNYHLEVKYTHYSPKLTDKTPPIPVEIPLNDKEECQLGSDLPVADDVIKDMGVPAEALDGGRPQGYPIRVKIAHWVASQEKHLQTVVEDYLKDTMYQYGHRFSTTGITTFDIKVKEYDDPNDRTFLYLEVRDNAVLFKDKPVPVKSFIENWVEGLSSKIDSQGLFAPIIVQYNGSPGAKLYLQKGEQSALMHTLNIYTKVLCHIHG